MGKHRKPEKPEKPANGDAPRESHKSKNKPKPNGRAPDQSHDRDHDHKKAPRRAATELLLNPRPDWHAADLPKIDVPNTADTPSPKVIRNVRDFAVSLLDAEAKLYADTHLKNSSSHKFMMTVMDSGTWTDKVSALTLVVQESPLHTKKELNNLMNMASKKSRDNALMALAAIKDLLAQGVLLPSDRKLRYFSKQPELLAGLLGVKPVWTPTDPLPNGLTEQHLIVWAYEDWLKQSYFDLLKVLESWCADTVENSRIRAVTHVFELLKEKPEQEENLLRLLVNKLGDNGRKIASRASYLLLQLQDSHPQMKPIIVAAVESEVLLKPGQSATARYYAAITLNQTVLSTSDPTTASKLLDVYFGVFVSILNKSKHSQKEPPSKGKTDSKKRKRESSDSKPQLHQAESELDDKLVGQILTGIHRAFPYCKSDTAKFQDHTDTMFRITHSSNFNTSMQALQLIQQISSSLGISTDRYMRTLYESLLDPRLLNSSKQTMYLNLLYRSLKADASMRRVKAFVKRLTQVLTLHEPPFICGALYLIHELDVLFPGLSTMLTQPEVDDDDDEEILRDVPDSDDEARPVANGVQASMAPKKDGYDPRKRDPDHSNADKACFWELPPWTNHYHPSTTLFARALLYPSAPVKGKGTAAQVSSFPPKPDPTSHTLMHFLDRFAYRNPKAPSDAKSGLTTRGSSLMQPALAASGATDTLFTPSRHGDAAPIPSAITGATSISALPTANSEAFWSRKLEHIPANDVFFHRYFSDIGPRRKAAAQRRAGAAPDKKKRAAHADDDEWDDDVGAGEDEIWRALVGSRPEIEDGGSADEASSADEDGEFAAAMADEDGSDDGVELNLESDDDEEDVSDGAGGQFADADDDDGGSFDLDDESALITDDDDDDDDDASDADGADGQAPAAKKRKGEGEGEGDDADKKKKKKKGLASLPTFASADDYARMIDDAEDGDGLDD